MRLLGRLLQQQIAGAIIFKAVKKEKTGHLHINSGTRKGWKRKMIRTNVLRHSHSHRFATLIILITLVMSFSLPGVLNTAAASAGQVTGVILDKNSDHIAVGSFDLLTATILPSDADNLTMYWVSSNTAVATVSFEGIAGTCSQSEEVTGVAAGTAIITVVTQDGSYMATCAVTVGSGGSNPGSGAGVSLTTPGPGQTYWPGQQVTVSGAATGLGAVDVAVYGPLGNDGIYMANGLVAGSGSFKTVFSLGDNPAAGTYTVWAGETGTSVGCTATFQVANPDQRISLTSPAPDQTYDPGDPVSIAGTVSNLAQATVSVTGPDGSSVFNSGSLNTSGGSLATGFTLSGTAVTGRYTISVGAPSLATPYTEKINVGQSIAGGPNTGQPDQIILSWTANPETTETVSWRTNDAMQDEVEYWPVNNSTGAQEVTATGNATYSVYCPGSYRFQATIQGLSPSTSYEYQVGGDGTWSRPASFITAAPYGDFTFLYMGDVQQGYQEWGDMLQVAAGENPKFALLGGDIVGDSSGSAAISEWQQFFAAATPLFSRVSLMPAAGNHDDGTLEWDSFAVPQNGPAGYTGFYSFDYENCHVAVLDSNDLTASGSGQYNTISTWLKNDLNSSSKTWKFVVLHYPPYEIYPDSRLPVINRCWAPIFEQCGVDLVFDGHQQVYARTSPIKNGQIQPDGSGTVYVMGNAGTFYYPIGPYFNYLVKETAYYSNYEAVNIDGATLTMTAKDANGNVIDSYQLTKQVVPVLTTLALSGSPGLAYSGQSLAYDLTGSSGLTLTGIDQNGNFFDLSGATVTWAVYSGPATLNSDGHTLAITGSGLVGVTASVGGITSSVFDLAVGGSTPPGGNGGTESFPILTAPPSYFERGLYISGKE